MNSRFAFIVGLIAILIPAMIAQLRFAYAVAGESPLTSPITAPLTAPISSPIGFITDPTINYITPVANFQSLITIQGTGFGSIQGTVTFYSLIGSASGGAPIVSWTDTQVLATVPAVAGNSFYFVSLERTDGFSDLTLLYVEAGQPVVNTITPSNAKPGDQIILTGSDFGDIPGAVDFFASNSAQIAGGSVVSTWSQSTIVANVPGILAGNQSYGVRVRASDGRVSSQQYYFVGAVPTPTPTPTPTVSPTPSVTATPEANKALVIKNDSLTNANGLEINRDTFSLDPEFTIEFWMKFNRQPVPGETLLKLSNNRLKIGIKDIFSYPRGYTTFVTTSDGRTTDTFYPGLSIVPGQWYHIAISNKHVVNGNYDTLTFYYNGRYERMNLSFADNMSYYRLDVGNVIDAELDEVRISNILRYPIVATNNSVYTVPISPFVGDSNTIALFHLNNGAHNAINNAIRAYYFGTTQYGDSTAFESQQTSLVAVPNPTVTPTPTSVPTPTPTVVPTQAPQNQSNSNNNSNNNSGSQNGGGSNNSSNSGSNNACTASKPGTPSVVRVAASGGKATVTWTRVENASSYSISYGVSSGNYQFGVNNVGNRETTSYTVGGLQAGRAYFFRVRAQNGCMGGDLSNEASSRGTGVVSKPVVSKQNTLGASQSKAKTTLNKKSTGVKKNSNKKSVTQPNVKKQSTKSPKKATSSVSTQKTAQSVKKVNSSITKKSLKPTAKPVKKIAGR